MDEIGSLLHHRFKTYAELVAAREEAGLGTEIKPYKCSKCQDTGWITVRRPDAQPTSIPCDCRSRTVFESSLRNSGIRSELLERCTMERFETNTENAKHMKEMAEAFLKDGSAKGFGCFGRSGTGKTHLCVAVCIKLAQTGRTVKYMAYNAVMRKLLANKFNEEGFAEILDPLAECNVLYIDDLFKNASDYRFNHLSQEEKRIMFELIDRRYQNNAVTIISTEMLLSEIQKEDEALASRIYTLVGKYGVKCEGQNRRFHE